MTFSLIMLLHGIPTTMATTACPQQPQVDTRLQTPTTLSLPLLPRMPALTLFASGAPPPQPSCRHRDPPCPSRPLPLPRHSLLAHHRLYLTQNATFLNHLSHYHTQSPRHLRLPLMLLFLFHLTRIMVCRILDPLLWQRGYGLLPPLSLFIRNLFSLSR
jgi:hypothetical protein